MATERRMIEPFAENQARRRASISYWRIVLRIRQCGSAPEFKIFTNALSAVVTPTVSIREIVVRVARGDRVHVRPNSSLAASFLYRRNDCVPSRGGTSR